MGLTQLQLAEDAFSDPTKVRRISDLENGLVANPHPKTIDPIIALLNISAEEVEECAKRTGGKIDPDLDRAYREARNLIEALAYKFEHANPDASLVELDQYLREKATEWRHLRARLDAIDGATAEIVQAKRHAAEALANGKLDEVDATLAALEERFQEQRTLVEIGKQAQIRGTRGDTCLMKGDAEGAFRHYLQAARFFQPFSEAESAHVLEENARRVYEASRRMMRPVFGIGIRLLEELLKLGVVVNDLKRSSAAHFRLGLICRNAASHVSDEEKTNLLQRALKHARLAAAQVADGGDLYKIVSAKVSVANCLLSLAEQHATPDTRGEAMTILRSARIIALEEEEVESQLCYISNNLGGAVLAAGEDAEGIPNGTAIEEALELFLEAIVSAERFNDQDIWGAAQMNRARLLVAKARQEDRNSDERAFLFVQAISSYHAAIETYPETLFSDRFAVAHFELASTLSLFSQIVPHGRAEAYMFRAIQSFEIAGAICADSLRERWAECQMFSGSVMARHAQLDVAADPEFDFGEAIRRFEAALGVYELGQDGKRIETCKHAIAAAKRELAELRSESQS
jgi:tetratricopeptide (TPR) repeat protein